MMVIYFMIIIAQFTILYLVKIRNIFQFVALDYSVYEWLCKLSVSVESTQGTEGPKATERCPL